MTIICFVPGIATAEQEKYAKHVGAVIRNSLAYHEGDYIEEAESVMGDIPKGYAEVEVHAKHEEFCESLTLDEVDDENDYAEQITAALLELDHDNDDHWTEAGLPSMNAIEELLGDVKVTREDVNAVDSEFKRNPKSD